MNLLLENSEYVDYFTDIKTLLFKVPQLQAYIFLISDLGASGCNDKRFN